MDLVVVVLSSLFVLTLLATAVLATRGRAERERAAALGISVAEERARAEAAQQAAARSLAAEAAAATRVDELERLLEAIVDERDAAATRRDAALAEHATMAREHAVMRQRLSDGEARIADVERVREEAAQAMQAAALKTTQLISSKLLDDHKRESEAAKKEGEALVKTTTEQLFQRFEQVSETVARLQGQVGSSTQQLDIVWRALKSPGGAGYFAEIGLANTLTSFGLVEGRDFALQHTTEDATSGKRLRPDAVVFLPGNSALVIDSKASKALVEIAEAEGSANESAAYESLSRTMNQHLKALADKDYRSAIATAWRESGRSGAITRLLSVMYLPNEGALEKLYRADPEFVAKAAKREIIPVGPAGLAGLIGFASVEISLVRQIENQQEIVRGAELLLDSVTLALAHAITVGKNVKSAADAYDRFAASVNGRLLSRSRKLADLGLRPGKALPGNLPRYHVQTLDSVVDAEAEEVSSSALPGLSPDQGELAILVQRAAE